MFIPDTNPVRPTITSNTMHVGEATQYEGKDMGGAFYRRQEKENAEKQEAREEKTAVTKDGHIDIVA